jgi:hypothetical protein
MQPVGLLLNLMPAHQGVGPLYQRDYWAVIDGCTAWPSQNVDDIARRFPEYPPPELVRFAPVCETPTLPRGDRLLHEGLAMPGPSVESLASARTPSDIAIEETQT